VLLKTKRLVLRELRVEDEGSLARYQCDRRYLEHYVEPPDARAIVASSMSWAAQSPRLNYQLAIAWSEQGPAIGCIGLRCHGQTSGTAEFGCELDPRLWEHGLAHEAASSLLDFGFGNLTLIRVVASTAPDNRRVHGLLTKLGFVPENEPDRGLWSRTRAGRASLTSSCG